MSLIHACSLRNWIRPHTYAWYEQLSRYQHDYSYSWDSILTEANGERLFDAKIKQVISQQHVLDIGCADGRHIVPYASLARTVTGIDTVKTFIQLAQSRNLSNTTFIQVSPEASLSFAQQFDVAIIRKGPTALYPNLKQLLTPIGKVYALHPTSTHQIELQLLFPHLFASTAGTDERIFERLYQAQFAHYTYKKIEVAEWIPSPTDILRICCFGQHPSIYEFLYTHCYNDLACHFNHYAEEKGLRITNSYFLIEGSF